MKNIKLSGCFTIISALLVTFSCSHRLSSVQDFAEHIARYSPPEISKSDPVWFELTTDVDSIVPMAGLSESLITISPDVKGKCYWKNSRTIEFRPDEGALKMGKSYVATLHLGRIIDVKKELADFSVAFDVQRLNYSIAVDSYDFSTESDDANEYSGEVIFNEQVDKNTVEKIVTASQDGKPLPVTIEPAADPKSHRFTVSKIRRSEITDKISIRTDAKSVGGERSGEISETVPAISDFSVYKIRTVMEPVPVVEVIFTDRLLEGQDLRGFFTANGGSVTITNIKTEGNKVRLSGDFPATGNVEIEVHEGIASRAGRKIAAAEKSDVSFVMMPPSMRLLRSGNIMPDAGELLLPIETRNLKALTIIVKQVFENNLPYFLQDGSLSGSNYRFINYGRVVLRKKIELSVNRASDSNELKVSTLDLGGLFERSPGSIYRIEVRADRRDAWTNCDSDEAGGEIEPETDYPDNEYYDEEEYYYYGPNWNWEERNDPCKDSYYMNDDMRLAVNLFASNIGLVAKSNSSNSQLLVIANNIMTTQPIAGCKIDVYDYQNQPLGSGTTDSEGTVTIPCPDQKPFIVLATNGKERGFLTVLDGSQLSTSRFDVGGKEIQKGLKGYVYGERGVWRPGDRIFLTFILDDTEQPLPAGHPVVLQLYNPQGQYFRKMVATSGVSGFYRFDIDTPQDAPTGAWRAVISVGGVTFTKMLRIETVKPNRLKINLQLNRPSGAPLSGTIEGELTVNWLQGAVGSNLGAQITATFKPLQTAFKGYEKYEFNSSVDRFEPREIEIFRGKVDAEGKARISYKAGKIENAPGMLTAEFVTRATEPGGDFSTYVQSETFSPYGSYVGIGAPQTGDGGMLETDRKNKLGIVVVDAMSQAVPGAAVKLEIYKIGWRWWWGGTREDMSSYISSSDTRQVASVSLTTNSAGRADYDFEVNYPEWGRYLVVATDVRSGHRSSTVLYVDYPAWRGSSALKDPEGLTMLTFTTDKTEYKVGDKVKVTIPKSSDGQAIVSLESGSSVIKMWRVKTSADSNTETSFEVTPEMAPNVYVAISLLQPYRNSSNDLPLRLYGIKNISVVNPMSKLTPVITMPDELKPEKAFTVKVGESGGREMTYTLAIVDDGLLDLTAFRTPDAWGEFYARRAHGVKMWDMYDNVMGRFGGSFGALYSIGGSDETINPGKQTSRFVPVVKFLGPFNLKKGAQNSHELTLPQYIGSVRVMVVAGNRGSYGSAQKTVPVRNPLMTLTTLPRVLGPGEEVVMPVNVFALEKGITNATVSIDCGSMFEALSPKSVNVAIDKSGEKLVVFRLKAKNRVGQGTVKITAASGNEKSGETINIAVRNPNPELISQVRKMLNKNEQATLRYDMEAGSTDDWMRLEASGGVQIDLNRRLDYLMTYPHGCSEQIASGALPQLYLDNFVELTKEQQQRVETNVSAAMNQLYSRQVSSGGVAYWPGDSKADEWITSYVGQFMFEAKNKGYSVMNSFVNDWGAYQRSRASKWTMTGDRYSQMTQAYRLYTLALWGMPDVGAMNRMREGSGLAPQAVWNLALAYGTMGKKDIALQLIFNQPVTFERYSPHNFTYGSSERDMATVLECWVLLGREDEAMKSAQAIADLLNKRDEYGTQTIAYQLLALSKFAKTMKGKEVTLDVEQTGGGKMTLTGKNRPMVRFELPVTPATGEVKLTNRGEDPLYATLTWRSVPFVDNSPAKNDGVSMKVNFTGVNGEAISPASIAQGTDFRVETVVTNTSPGIRYTNLALVQIFPSGWEIFNDRMLSQSDGGGMSTGLSYQDIRDDRVMSYFDLAPQRSIRITVKLRATYKGRFFMPAYSCKAMYDSSVEARTTGNWVEVK